jgi:phosphatidylserine/phosphatidylglycerophosphate/cardiolipin synthase-like enzyme
MSVATTATRIPEREYFDLVLASIEAARRRVWVAMFIYDIRPGRDIAGHVMTLSLALAARRHAGVDVRVLTAGQLFTADIAAANLASGGFLARYGVPNRRIFGTPEQPGSHAKFVVCDDLAMIGSQNWTDDAFRLNVEDALLLRGGGAERLAGEFLTLWAGARGFPRHAA